MASERVDQIKTDSRIAARTIINEIVQVAERLLSSEEKTYLNILNLEEFSSLKKDLVRLFYNHTNSLRRFATADPKEQALLKKAITSCAYIASFFDRSCTFFCVAIPLEDLRFLKNLSRYTFTCSFKEEEALVSMGAAGAGASRIMAVNLRTCCGQLTEHMEYITHLANTEQYDKIKTELVKLVELAQPLNTELVKIEGFCLGLDDEELERLFATCINMELFYHNKLDLSKRPSLKADLRNALSWLNDEIQLLSERIDSCGDPTPSEDPTP